jgi:hypothetical protein
MWIELCVLRKLWGSIDCEIMYVCVCEYLLWYGSFALR